MGLGLAENLSGEMQRDANGACPSSRTGRRAARPYKAAGLIRFAIIPYCSVAI